MTASDKGRVWKQGSRTMKKKLLESGGGGGGEGGASRADQNALVKERVKKFSDGRKTKSVKRQPVLFYFAFN